MEDSFQSSPNSVTKTRFRNKILRTLFLSHLSADFSMQKPISTHPHLSRAPARSSGWRCVPGGGEECERAMGHKRVAHRGHPAPRRQPRGSGPAPRARLSAQAQLKAPTPALELPLRSHLFKANTSPKYTSPSFKHSSAPQTNPHTSNSPHSFPNSKQETPPPGFKPSAHRGDNQEERVGEQPTPFHYRPHKLPHPRPCVRVAPVGSPPLPPSTQSGRLRDPSPAHSLSPPNPSKKKKSEEKEVRKET